MTQLLITGNDTEKTFYQKSIWLIVPALLLALCLILEIPIFDPDESLFIHVSKEMIQSGDWITPTYLGEPFLDRPILFYWFQSAIFLICGINSFSCRLIPISCGILTIWLTGKIAQILFNNQLEIDSRNLSSTSIALTLICMAIGHDSLLVLFSTAAVWSLLSILKSPTESKPKHIILLIIWFTGGILTKGLLGLVLPAIGYFALVASGFAKLKRPKDMIKHIGILTGLILIAALVSSIWYLKVESSNPGYIKYFFIDRHFGGYLTNDQRHGEKSIVLYLITIFAGGIPWILFLIPTNVRLLKSPISICKSVFHVEHQGTRFLIFWWLGIVFFFSLAGSKNPTYLLPSFPALMILISIGLTRKLECFKANPNDRNYFPRLITYGYSLALAFIIVIALPFVAWERSTIWVCKPLESSGIDMAQWKENQYHSSLTSSSFPKKIEVWWFNNLQPSAFFYAPSFEHKEVYFDDIQITPTEPVILVSRESRLVETAHSPMTRNSKHHHVYGKYHLFFCGKWSKQQLEILERNGFHLEDWNVQKQGTNESSSVQHNRFMAN